MKNNRPHFYFHFLNPFGKQEAKIRLFNIGVYNKDYFSLRIDILNVTISIYYWK
jgi:hypothetical protein